MAVRLRLRFGALGAWFRRPLVRSAFMKPRAVSAFSTRSSRSHHRNSRNRRIFAAGPSVDIRIANPSKLVGAERSAVRGPTSNPRAAWAEAITPRCPEQPGLGIKGSVHHLADERSYSGDLTEKALVSLPPLAAIVSWRRGNALQG